MIRNAVQIQARRVCAVLFAAALLFMSFAAPPACAQSPLAIQKAMEQQPEAAKVTDADIGNLIKTLEEPEKRDAFLTNLKAMQSVKEKDSGSTPGVMALDAMSKAASDAGKNFSSIVQGFADLPQASSWFERQWKNEEARLMWVEVFVEALAALAIGGLLFFLVDFLLRRPRAFLAETAPLSLAVRVFAFAGYHFMALLPVIAFTIATLFTLSSFAMPVRPERAVSAIIYAFITMQLLVWLLRMIFAARIPRLRFLPLDNESAAYLYVWSQRLGGMIVFGYFLAQAALIMGVPSGSVHAFAAFIGLVVTLMVIIIVLQNRQNVATWLRGKPDEQALKPNILHIMRARLADIWHVLAIVYLCVGFLIASLDIEQGFGVMIRATVITIAAAIGFRFILSGIDQLMAHGFALPEEFKRQFPGLEERTNSYLPLLQRVLKGLAWILGLLVLISAWGVDTVAWFATPFGKKILGSGISIVLTLVLAVVFWEMISSLSDRYILGKDATGRTIERSARMRTLMPLIRHSLHIILVVVAGLIVLFEFGVDVTPLLAGAGIIGLAIGFGSQTLVKDFITGLFILLEDTVAVGDVVTIGDHSGVIEEISIRTLRLRDVEGRVHSIPFSEVRSIINQTKYFAYALIEIGVAYDADLRQVMQVMKQVADGMYDDPAYKHMIFEPIEIMGVERFDASSIALRGRIKTAPGKQWVIKREYFLRLKDAFDREHIDIPFPTTMTIQAQKSDTAQETKTQMPEGA